MTVETIRLPATAVIALVFAGACAAGAPDPAPPPPPDPPPPTTLPVQGMESVRIGLGIQRIALLDPLGLGSEAKALGTWIGDRFPVALGRDGEGHALVRADGSSRHLSPTLGNGLRRFERYAAASTAGRAAPLTAEDLRAAATAPLTVTRIRELFDRALSERVVAGGTVLIPELGGEAALDEGALDLPACDDPTRPLLRAVAAASGDPPAVGRLLEAHPVEAALVDGSGQLAAEVRLWTERIVRDVPEERRRAGWSRALATVLQGASDAFVLHPKQQLECILTRDWSGRALGPWHLHPPTLTPSDLLPGEPPSPDDLQVARNVGQFLTITFRPDGYDLHDLAGVASGADIVRIEYRSEDWRRHFAARHLEVVGH